MIKFPNGKEKESSKRLTVVVTKKQLGNNAIVAIIAVLQ